jgi:flagellar biosynthesis protein FlhG
LARSVESRDSSTWRDAQQRLLAELQSLASQFEVVVLDVGSGLTPWSRRFWLQAKLVLLVTSADGTALLDSYAMIKRSVADGAGPDVRLVVNPCDDDRVAMDTHRRLSESCRQFLHHDLPAVPALPRHVVDAHTDSWPRVWETPNTPFGHAVLWLGRAVGDVLSSAMSAARVEAA